MDVLYLVIPCYNEAEVLPITSARLEEKMTGLIQSQTVSPQSRILFVDDGSRDDTWAQIEALHRQNRLFSGLKLARNSGHQNALLAGLMQARTLCDVAISMDADLQDDVDAIDRFLDAYRQDGCDVVYGVRAARDRDSVFKRTTALCFYKTMSLLGVDIVCNHADYRLMSRRALDALSEFREVNLFLRGIIPLIGFKSGTVPYARGERAAGKSKYPLKKMLGFALEGITSFSIRPIRMVLALGALIFAVSLVLLVVFFVQKLCGMTVQGWSSLICSIWMIGGIQLLCLGVIGEYIGKIYKEVKARPKYICEAFLSDAEKD